MTFNDLLQKPSSSKIVLVEVDSPLSVTWINYQPGIWQTTISPGSQDIYDDHGNSGYYEGRNNQYYNINSLNVSGELYSEVTSLALCISTNKSWFYDTSTTKIYAHFGSWNPPEYYSIIAPGAVIGFTLGEDKINNNYFEDIYYIPSVKSIPNLSKAKDALFFGLLQYQGGSVSFYNEDGWFDDFATRDLYGQPIRILLSFEGLPYSEALLVYSGRVEDFEHDLTTFKINIADTRKLLSRKLPINTLADGTPIPLIFGSVIKVPAYKTSSGNWTFADTTYNSIDSGITVYDKDGNVYAHGGTETDGTFTATDTNNKLYVTCNQSTIQNGLDIIAHILEKYEGIDYNSAHYDTTEWTTEKSGVKNEGIWIGKGNLKTSADIIEQICTDNQGIFDVLADGRFTFRSYNPDRIPEYEIFQDELLDDPSIIYDANEYLSSVKIEYTKDWLDNESEIYTNSDYESEVYGRYRQYKERTFTTALTNITDAESLSEDIMTLSKFIYPSLSLVTKTQNIGLRILDNLLYTFERQNGKKILNRSRFQVLGVNLNLSSYEISITIKQIEEDLTSRI